MTNGKNSAGHKPKDLADIKPSDRIGTKLLFEDDAVRVWELKLLPGEATQWHQHTYPHRFIVTSVVPGIVHTEYIDGTVEIQAGDTLGATDFRLPGMPERLVNVGKTMYQNIVIEFKNERLD